MIVFDTSTLVGAVIRPGKPRRALQHGCTNDVPALSQPVWRELLAVLHRPRLARFIDPIARDQVLELLRASAVWFNPDVPVRDCRDTKDNVYLELALAAAAQVVVSSDEDLLVLHPWRGIAVISPSQYVDATSPQPKSRPA